MTTRRISYIAGRFDWLVVALALNIAASLPAAEPLRLHPDNPHYFLFRGKPTILLSSAEHYGAVLNSDFDYKKYLATLKKHGFNQTRMFTGAYCEPQGAFNIQYNTLAPAKGKLLCPWGRSGQEGYANGGRKFDLVKWDDAYFARLRDYVAEAGKCGVVVEVVLFCPFYEESQWKLSPVNADNNVNGVGKLKRTDVYTLKDQPLQDAQDAMVRKIVAELAQFDNVYYEICNEAYFGGVTQTWQDHLAQLIVDAEAKLKTKHLIAQNIANKSAKIERPNPHVSIFNFHYATPPEAVSINYHLNKPIGDDETGFRGPGDAAYRTEAWDFLIAGGAEYSNLDYSFTVGHEDGTAKNKAPGGGGPELRKQLEILREFINGFEFVKMKPANDVIKGGVPKKATARVLAEPGKAYAIYLRGGEQVDLQIELAKGSYQADWVHTKTAAIDKTESFQHDGGERTVSSPKYQEDIALRIQNK